MYNAERRLLGNALLDYSNEWFVLLSEACIPLDNFRNTYEYITSSRLNFVQSNVEEDDSSAAALVVKEGSSGGRGGGGGGSGSRLSREQEQEMGPEITRQNFRKSMVPNQQGACHALGRGHQTLRQIRTRLLQP